MLKQGAGRHCLVVSVDLGMLDYILPSRVEYDFILIPGGARKTCLYRTRYVKQLLCEQGIRARECVGLTGLHIVADSARSATDTYAPDAVTEYDLMKAAIEREFQAGEIFRKESEILGGINKS